MRRAGRIALDQYDLTDATLESAAYVNNAVFKVTMGNGKKYVLRLHRPGHKLSEWIRSELVWLDSIRQHTSLQVPEPVMTKQGEILTSTPVDGLEAPVTAVVFNWIEGDSYPNEILPIDKARQAGEFLARLHTFSATFTAPADFSRPRLDWNGLFGEESTYDPGEGARIFTDEQKMVFGAVEQRVREVMYSIGQQANTFGLIHADFIAKNWLFKDESIAVIDFDDCSWGYYLYDLAPALLQFKYEPRYTALREAFLAGYTDNRSFSSDDERHLEAFIAARHLASCRWLAGNLHNPRIRERAADLITHRTGELRHFLETGSIDEGGRKEFF